MSDNNTKALRKQIRNIVQELLPEILTSEVIRNLDAKLTNVVLTRLQALDQRQKDIQHYIMNQSTVIQNPKSKE